MVRPSGAREMMKKIREDLRGAIADFRAKMKRKRKNMFRKLEWMKKEIEEIRREEAVGDTDKNEGGLESSTNRNLVEEEATKVVDQRQNADEKRKNEEKEIRETQKIEGDKSLENIPGDSSGHLMENTYKGGGSKCDHRGLVIPCSTIKRRRRWEVGSVDVCESGCVLGLRLRFAGSGMRTGEYEGIDGVARHLMMVAWRLGSKQRKGKKHGRERKVGEHQRMPEYGVAC